MAGNIEQIFGPGGFIAADYPAKTFEFPVDPKENLRKKAAEFNIELPFDIIVDEKIHRFPTNGKQNDDAGWYVFFQHEKIIAGSIGDYRESFSQNIHSSRKELTKEDLQVYRERIKIAKEKAEIERASWIQEKIKYSESEWAVLFPAPVDHPYLKDKGLSSNYGLKIDDRYNLVLPRKNAEGRIQTFQRIWPQKTQGGKWNKPNDKGPAKDTYFLIGDPGISDKIYVAEGIATAATVYEETGRACYVAFSADNLPFAAMIAKTQNQNKRVIIAADNGDAGEKNGRKAADLIGGDLIVCPGEGGTDFNDYRAMGGNVKEILNPISMVESLGIVFGDEISDEYIPPDELVEDILVKGQVALMYGDSNSGKTFLALSLSAAISEGSDFFGKRTERGIVLYLPIEAPGSIRERMQAMNRYYGKRFDRVAYTKEVMNFYNGDADTKTLLAIKEVEERYKDKVSMVVVDTLSQASAGANENSEEMIVVMQAITRVATANGVSVLVIHHSGKDKTKGARGFSGINAVLDTEIHVEDTGEIKTATITKQRSLGSKGEELFYKLEIIEMGIGKFGNMKSTCVAIPTEEKPDEKTDENKRAPKKEKFIKIIKKSWHEHGEEEMGGRPYITRSALEETLVEMFDYKDRTLKNHLNPSYEDKIIGYLILNEIIKKEWHGWVIIEENLASQMMQCKNPKVPQGTKGF